MSRKKVLVVCSHGGHFDAAVAVLPAFRDFHVELVSYRNLGKVDLIPLSVEKLHVVMLWGSKIGFRLGVSLIVNVFEAAWILARFRPDIIFSTGSEISIPFVLIARLFTRIRFIHLETATRPQGLSISGRWMLPFCHRFFVQWSEAVGFAGDRAEFAGRVF